MTNTSPRRTVKKAKTVKRAATTRTTISVRSLNTNLDRTLAQLRKHRRTPKRDWLIALLRGLRAKTRCGKTMALNLEG